MDAINTDTPPPSQIVQQVLAEKRRQDGHIALAAMTVALAGFGAGAAQILWLGDELRAMGAGLVGFAGLSICTAVRMGTENMLDRAARGAYSRDTVRRVRALARR